MDMEDFLKAFKQLMGKLIGLGVCIGFGLAIYAFFGFQNAVIAGIATVIFQIDQAIKNTTLY